MKQYISRGRFDTGESEKKIQRLIEQLNDPTPEVRQYAAEALIHQYINKREWGKVEKLLKHESDDVKYGALWGLRQAACLGQDMIPAVPALWKALGDENAFVRLFTIRVLGYLQDPIRSRN